MSAVLNVALVLDRYNPNRGGLEVWTHGFAQWLVGRGHKVTILCARAEAECPGAAFHLYAPGDGPLARAANIDTELTRLTFDIVHDMGFATTGDALQPHTGSRLVNREHENAAMTPYSRWRRKLSPGERHRWRETAILERRQFSDPSRIIAISALVRDQIAARYNLDATRIAVIRNGIETARFAGERLSPLRGAARAKWRFGEATVFLLVANNFLLKGLGTAQQALARLGIGRTGLLLAVAGKGPVEEYSCLAEKLGVAESVRFLGHVGRIEEAYAAADVALHPTYHDACSLVTLEELASGLPLITTRANGGAERMVSGEQGFLLDDPHDALALCAAIARMSDASLRQRMGEAARRLGRAWTAADNYAAMESFYEAALTRRRGTGAG